MRLSVQSSLLALALSASAVAMPGVASATDIQMWVRASGATAAQYMIDLWNASHNDKVVVTVRPEAISVSPLAVDAGENTGNSTTARVEQVVYRGFMLHYYLRLDNGEPMIAYRQTQTEGFTNAVSAAGDRVRLSWTTDSNHVIQLN